MHCFFFLRKIVTTSTQLKRPAKRRVKLLETVGFLQGFFEKKKAARIYIVRSFFLR